MNDLRYAVRTLSRTPGLTAVALLALTLGIGANSAIFSVVYAALLRPLPVRDPARLVAINAYNPKFNIPPIQPSYSVYGVWKTQSRAFDSVAASWSGVADLDTEKLPHWRVTASFFPTLEIHPPIARPFAPIDDHPGAPTPPLTADALWTRRFNRDPAI